MEFSHVAGVVTSRDHSDDIKHNLILALHVFHAVAHFMAYASVKTLIVEWLTRTFLFPAPFSCLFVEW